MLVTPRIRAAIIVFAEFEIKEELRQSKAVLDQFVDDLPTPDGYLAAVVARKLAVQSYENLFDPKVYRKELGNRCAYYMTSFETIKAPENTVTGKPWSATAGKFYNPLTLDDVDSQMKAFNDKSFRDYLLCLKNHENSCRQQFVKFLPDISEKYHREVLGMKTH